MGDGEDTEKQFLAAKGQIPPSLKIAGNQTVNSILVCVC